MKTCVEENQRELVVILEKEKDSKSKWNRKYSKHIYIRLRETLFRKGKR